MAASPRSRLATSRPRERAPWWLPWGAMAVVLAAALAIGARPRHDPSLDERVDGVAQTIRCEICVGESVATSDSPFAQQARQQIRRQLVAGRSPSEIRAYFVDKYGNDISLLPSGSGFDALVWVLPVVVIVLGAGGLALAFWRWRNQRPAVPSAEDEELVEATLARRGEGSGGAP